MTDMTHSISCLLCRERKAARHCCSGMVLLHITEAIVDGIIDVHGDYLHNAKKLNLSSNGIRYIDDLSKLNDYLTKLDLSFNDIEDIRGLQTLSKLEELNLSGNQLTSMSDIRQLTNLTFLDISENNITHLSDIQMLNNLPHLKELKLARNPLCASTLVYPYAVLAALPAVRVLDGKSREELMASTPVHRPLSRPAAPPPQAPASRLVPSESHAQVPRLAATSPSSSPPSAVEAISTSHTAQLQQQLAYAQSENAAYADMFRVAERALAHKAPKEVLTSHSPGSRPDIDCIMKYNYADLLKLWRQKVHALTLQGLLDAQERKALKSSVEKLKLAAEEEQASFSQSDSTLRSRLQAAEQLIAAQAAELAAVHTAFEEATARQSALEQQVSAHKLQDQHIRKFLVTFRAEVDQQLVASSLLEVKLQRRLASFAARFAALQDRLSLLQSLNAQKDVQMRNTAAAFEAERRLLAQWTEEEVLRHSQVETKVAQADPHASPSKSSSCASTEGVRIPGCFASRPGPSLSITAECEAFLRSVFRQLDPDDSGTVSLRLLLQCLHTAAARGLLRCDHSIARGSEVGASRGSGRRQSDDGQKFDLWAKLIHGLEVMAEESSGGGAEDITWGEFLLLLCPSPPAPPARRGYGREWGGEDDGRNYCHDEQGYEDGCNGLSSTDHRQLHHAKLLGDLDWAMVPLSLPPSAFEADESALVPNTWLRTVVTGHGVEFDVSRLKKEAIRLAKERAFLLRKVQSMSRSLERRATSIRSYFIHDLRKLTLKSESVQRSLRDCQVHEGQLEERVQELNVELQHERSQSRTQHELLSAQLADLQARLADASSREEMGQLERVLVEYREKMDQTESELRIVRKELSKAALTHKTLQRDLKRHQATETAAVELLEEYKAKYKEQKRTSSALEGEQEALASRLAAAEEALEAMKAQQQQQERREVERQETERRAAAAKEEEEEEHQRELEILRKQEQERETSKDREKQRHPPGPETSPSPSPPPRLGQCPQHQHQHQHQSSHPQVDPRRGLDVRADDRDFDVYLAASHHQHHQQRLQLPPPRTDASPGPRQSQQQASGLALENVARKLRMMAESIND